jgi:hypothetical protein
VAADLESARREWLDAYRRLEQESREPGRAEPLWAQVEVVSEELRRRVGGRFTLRELAAEYRTAEVWVREVVSQRAPTPGWPRTLSLVEGAAFHAYARGAEDYEP